MKKILPIISLILLSLCGCAKTKSLEGNWETTALIKDGIAQQIAVSNINFVVENKQLFAKGRAGVNLYNASIKIQGNKFEASKMTNTGFNGQAAAMEFEDLFFDALMNSTCFKIQDDTLYLFDESKSRELQLRRKPLSE